MRCAWLSVLAGCLLTGCTHGIASSPAVDELGEELVRVANAQAEVLEKLLTPESPDLERKYSGKFQELKMEQAKLNARVQQLSEPDRKAFDQKFQKAIHEATQRQLKASDAMTEKASGKRTK